MRQIRYMKCIPSIWDDFPNGDTHVLLTFIVMNWLLYFYEYGILIEVIHPYGMTISNSCQENQFFPNRKRFSMELVIVLICSRPLPGASFLLGVVNAWRQITDHSPPFPRKPNSSQQTYLPLFLYRYRRAYRKCMNDQFMHDWRFVFIRRWSAIEERTLNKKPVDKFLSNFLLACHACGL